jgi:hypothetical protein
MGPEINSYANEMGASVSPDNQYLLFAGHKNGFWDLYWVDAKIIEDLKPKELK